MVKILRHKNFITLIPIIILISIIALRLFEPTIVQRERLIIFDIYQLLQPRIYQPLPVKIIDIDDESLKRIGQWPWSRTVISQLITNLSNAGTAAIGFDIVFAEADNTSLHNTLPLWKQILSDVEYKQLKTKLVTIPSYDEALAQVIAKTKVVLGFSFIQQTNNTVPVVKSGISISGASPQQTLLNFQGAVKNLDLFEQVATGNGSFNITAEIDSIVRRLPLIYHANNNYYPSLVLELLRVAQGDTGIIIKTQQVNENEPVTVESIKVGNTIIPTDAAGNLLVYYTQEIPTRTIPAWKILENKLQSNELSGNIVLVGTSAAGLKDQRPTPLNSFSPGVEIQANALEQVISGSYLYRPDWLTGLEITVMAVIGLFLIRFMSRFGSMSIIVTLLFISIIVAVSWYTFKYYHWLVDPVYPSIAILIIYLIVSLLNYFKSESERKYVRNAFSHYISPALVEKLVKNTEVLTLGGEMRDMSVLFCDIRGFTSISEQLDAGHLTQFINQFLTSMTTVILNEKGTIDKYIGDCIMALWNAPLEDINHATNACTAALKMLDALTLFNNNHEILARKENRPFIKVHVGIGINSGICCVGNMGSNMRFDYSVLGDNVNLASRLEGQSKTYGANIIISEYTLASMKMPHQEFAVLELDLMRVKGKLKPVRIYALLGFSGVANSDDFIQLAEIHRNMMTSYYLQNWQEVLLLINRCQALDKFDLSGFYQVYQQRVESFIATPPESSWDGVYIATVK
ncbi:MAG: adenylate/guanylate cyclase domain-containing protein [Methylococcales bacterium]|nr:adenylate/guanylate cyclase domain-containing protein [Methylococcales bacterium]